jgi:hypothetical protein
MRKRGKSVNGWVRVLMCTLMLTAIPVAVRAHTAPDFSGLWTQENDRCEPKRSGDVTMLVEQNGSEFTVETSIARGLRDSRRAVQKYTLDGKVSISTGTDGDEFHTSVAWKNSSLIFSIEEHEDGRILRSKETWSLIDDGTTLQRTREHPDGDKQVLYFRRQR